MTAENRIFLRRHLKAFSDLSPDARAVRNATIRAGKASGCRISDMARFFSMNPITVSYAASPRASRDLRVQLEHQRQRVKRLRNALAQAEGRERAIESRIRSRGWEVPKSGSGC